MSVLRVANVQFDSTQTNLIDLPTSNTIRIVNNGAETVRILPTGNVGIGTATPAFKLDIVGSANVSVGLGIGTSPSGVAGDIRATADVTAYYSSDERLKTNIQPINNALDKALMISGVMFDWSDEYIEKHGGEDGYFIRKHDIGVIAQQVEKVVPEVVATREDGIKAVRYDRLVALLIEAIRELNQKLESK